MCFQRGQDKFQAPVGISRHRQPQPRYFVTLVIRSIASLITPVATRAGNGCLSSTLTLTRLNS
jgi:hypothetical protein